MIDFNKKLKKETAIGRAFNWLKILFKKDRVEIDIVIKKRDVDYKIFSSRCHKNLEGTIKNYMNKGYKLSGSVQIVILNEGRKDEEIEYYQSIFKD